jgi:hypothetical protein
MVLECGIIWQVLYCFSSLLLFPAVEALIHASVLQVLCCAAALLTWALPIIFFPFYESQGAVIYSVSPTSPLMGHVIPGDCVTAVDDVPIASKTQWQEMLQSMFLAASSASDGETLSMKLSAEGTVGALGREADWLLLHRSRGYCLNSVSTPSARSKFASLGSEVAGELVSDCCVNPSVSSLQCFGSWNNSSDEFPFYSCMSARSVIMNSASVCRHSSDCGASSDCLIPAIAAPALMINISFENKLSIIFVGSPAQLLLDLQFVNLRPRPWLLGFAPSWAVEAILAIPRTFQLFLYFLLNISAGIGLINVAPVYFLDGQFITYELVEICTFWLHRQLDWYRNEYFSSGDSLFRRGMMSSASDDYRIGIWTHRLLKVGTTLFVFNTAIVVASAF